jgi:hypothetical protein
MMYYSYTLYDDMFVKAFKSRQYICHCAQPPFYEGE